MLGDEHAVWTPPGFGAWVEIALAPPADLVSLSPDIIAINPRLALVRRRPLTMAIYCGNIVL